MEQLITAYYNAILRVDPTPAQVQLWLNLIDPDNPDPGIEDLADALCFQSPETISLMKIYQVVLGRVPDSGGLDFWVQVFRDIREANPELTYEEALVATIRDWLESEEFTDVYGTELSVEEYVSLLYINILNRPPDQAGFDFWVNEVKTGVITREELVIAFSESAEFGSMVDAEAKGILLYDAQISSIFKGDDPEHRVENDDPYGGELQNEAPLDILLGTDVDENSAEDVEVNDGQLTVVDPDAGDSHTWELVDDADGAFKLDDPNAQSPKIIVADSSKLDHETADVMYVTVRVTDSRGETLEKTFPIDINDINEEPYNLDLSNMTIDEQDGSVSNPGVAGTVVGILTADDVDDGAFGDLTFSTADPRFAIINGNELIVADPAAFDAENGVSSVDVVVRVTDGGGLFEEKTFTIDVTPIVDEDPTDILPDTLNVSANTPVGLSLVELVAVDPDTSPDSHTFQITNDPTDQGGGGAFAMDITGTKLVLADPTKINSTNLLDNGPVDTDGLLNGLIVFELEVLATDSNGNTYTDTIQVTVDQNGDIIPFTDTIVEVLDGTNGDDVFTANAGFGWFAPVPGFNQTANPGDIANGEGGDDLFVLTKGDNNFDPFGFNPPDGAQLVSGVVLNDIENALFINEDQSNAPVLGDLNWPGPGGPVPVPLQVTSDVCSPCINLPPIAPVEDDALIFDASLAAELDHVSMGQSRASIGVWDLQDDFWVAAPGDENDLGPVWDIFDMTANVAWLDSDPQSKLPDEEIDELIVTLDEVRLNELRITENASGNEPGFGPREEQLGTISLKASGVPSIIGSINNGWQGGPTLPGWLPVPVWGPALGTATHTLNIDVANLTGTTPTSAVGPAAAAANTAAIDFFAGQADGLGNGLLGLQNVNIAGPVVNGVQQPAGDVFLVFGDAANDIDTDGDNASLEILDGEGSSFFFFEEDGFGQGDDGTAVRIDGGDGYDTVGVFTSDLASFLNDINYIVNVERLKVLDTASGILYLDPFSDDLQIMVLAGGVSGDLNIRNIPDLSQEGATTDQSLLCDDFGVEGFVIEIDQCCWPDPNNPTGDLPDDFDLFLLADGANDTARIATIFNVDPGNVVGDGVVTADNITVRNVDTYHLRVVDCDNDTDGLFEVRYLGSDDQALRTLLLTSDSGGDVGDDTTKILQDPASDLGVPGGQTTPNLTLIKGTGDSRNQEFLEFDPSPLAAMKMLSIAEDWGDDTNNNRPSGLDRTAEPDNIINELVVSNDGAVVDLGEGNDIFTGNRTPIGGPGRERADFIRGNGGNDLLFGAGGNDQIEGGSGDDEIQGEEGDDCLFGDSGDDLILAGSGNDFADGGADDDIIFGGSGEDHLRGGTGDDFICGGDDDDSLYGEQGNDLLIGGEGDDFLDAGSSGTDMLIGDYGCEPCYVNITVPAADLEEGDTFTIGVDLDGNGTIDGDEEFTVIADATPTIEEIADQLADLIIAKLGTESDLVQSCWMVEADGGVVRLCKVDDVPLVSFNGTDAPVASVHKFEFDGQVHPTDEIQLNIQAADQLGANFDLDDIPGLTPPANGLFYDSIPELLTLAQEVAAYLDTQVPAGYSVEANAQGQICIIGPGDDAGTDPVIAFTIVDGPEVDAPAVPEIQFVDLSDLTGFEIGDRIVVAWTTADDGADIEGYTVQLGDTLADIISGLQAAINGGVGVNAIIDPNDPNRICIISDTPGLAGEFTVDAAIGLLENFVGAPDEFIELTFTDFDTAGEAFSVDISDGNGPVLGPVTYGQVFDTSLLQTLQNFIAQHGATILADHDLVVSIGGAPGNETLVFTGEDFVVNGVVIAADYTGNGSVSASAPANVNATLAGGSEGIKQLPQDDFQDDTQSIVDLGITVNAQPRLDLDLSDQVEVEDKSEPGQDVFVTSARANDMAAFANNGYDNDDRPDHDFQGLLAASGLGTGDGADIGAGRSHARLLAAFSLSA